MVRCALTSAFTSKQQRISRVITVCFTHAIRRVVVRQSFGKRQERPHDSLLKCADLLLIALWLQLCVVKRARDYAWLVESPLSTPAQRKLLRKCLSQFSREEPWAESRKTKRSLAEWTRYRKSAFNLRLRTRAWIVHTWLRFRLVSADLKTFQASEKHELSEQPGCIIEQNPKTAVLIRYVFILFSSARRG